MALSSMSILGRVRQKSHYLGHHTGVFYQNLFARFFYPQIAAISGKIAYFSRVEHKFDELSKFNLSCLIFLQGFRLFYISVLQLLFISYSVKDSRITREPSQN